MLICATLASLLSFRRIKVIAVLQDTSGWMLKRWAIPLQRLIYGLSEEVIVTSEGFADQLLRKFNVIESGREIHYLPNVPSVEVFAGFSPRAWSGTLTVGVIGMIRGDSGLRTLVEAVRLAREDGCDVRILFAGKCLNQQFLDEMVKANSFVEYIGPYDHADIKNIYQKIDVIYGIYDQSYDKTINLSYRFCEAMVCGIPIICSSDSHMGKLAKEEKTGFVLPLGDAEAMIELLVRIHRNPKILQDASMQARKHQSKYLFGTFSGKMLELFQGAVGSGISNRETRGSSRSDPGTSANSSVWGG